MKSKLLISVFLAISGLFFLISSIDTYFNKKISFYGSINGYAIVTLHNFNEFESYYNAISTFTNDRGLYGHIDSIFDKKEKMEIRFVSELLVGMSLLILGIFQFRKYLLHKKQTASNE